MEVMTVRVCTYENALTEQHVNTVSGEAICQTAGCHGVEHISGADLDDLLRD